MRFFLALITLVLLWSHALANPQIAGTVFEDTTSNLIPDPEAIGDTDNAGISGVSVRLFNTSGTQIATTTSGSNGYYVFSGVGTNSTYYVAVDAPVSGSAVAEQTYGNAGTGNSGTAGGTGYGTLCVGSNYSQQSANTLSNSAANPSNGACYGGRRGTTADAGTTVLGNKEHVTRVVVGTTDVLNVNFGFSYNVVSNTNVDGQGSMAQFVTNANTLAEANSMRFIPAVAQNAGTENIYWSIARDQPFTTLEGANAAGTTIDGTAYSYLDGTTLVNSNSGQLGSGGTVGTGADGKPDTGDEHVLPKINKPELEVISQPVYTDNWCTPLFCLVDTEHFTLRHIALLGRISFFSLNVQNITIEHTVFGLKADGSQNTFSSDTAIIMSQPSGSINIKNNIIADLAIPFDITDFDSFSTPQSILSIYENEIYQNSGFLMSINQSINSDFKWNLIHDANTDFNIYPGSMLFTENTFHNNTYSGLMLVSSNDNTVAGNVFSNNNYSGVLIVDSTGNKVSQNAFINNARNAIDLGSDGVSINTNSCTAKDTNGANNNIARPIITAYALNNSTLTVAGTLCDNASTYTLEFYKANGAGTANGTANNDYGSDNKMAGEGVEYLGSLIGLTAGTFSGSFTVTGMTNTDTITAIAIRTATGGVGAVGDTSEFGVFVPPAVSGYSVRGSVYADTEPDQSPSASENWNAGVTAYVNLVKNGSVVASQTISIGSGNYLFSNVAAGTYTVVISNSATSTAPIAPPGWIFINPLAGNQNITVSNKDVYAVDFGLFQGYKINGAVFYDDGFNSSTAAPYSILSQANNGMKDGNEKGIAGVEVTATAGSAVRKSISQANGIFNLYLPHSNFYGQNVTISHSRDRATGYTLVGTGTTTTLATSTSGTAARTVVIPASDAYIPQAIYFGVLRPSTFAPDQAGMTVSPGTIEYTHNFQPSTLGTFFPSVVGDLSYPVLADLNNDGTIASSELLTSGLAVDANWKRESDGSFATRLIKVRVNVPSGLAVDTVDTALVQGAFTWRNLNIVQLLKVRNVTTIGLDGNLSLVKGVRNISQEQSEYGVLSYAIAGETLEYRVTFTNLGITSLKKLRLSDPVPFFSDVKQDAYGAAKDIEVHCPSGNATYIDLEANVTITGFTLLEACGQENLEPNQEGYFSYQVQTR